MTWGASRRYPDGGLYGASVAFRAEIRTIYLHGRCETWIRHAQGRSSAPCGNLLLASDAADVTCCGQTLRPLTPQTPDAAHRLTAELSDGEWYLTSGHPMRREHYLSFAALVNEDTVVLRRLYPEWGAQTRLPYFAHGTLLWYCTQHGLFAQPIDTHKT